jgi:pimeloyl-ACP methyl ester carboxylesterase
LLGRGPLGLLVILVLLIPVGLAYQAYALRRDQQAFPPPGRMVEVDGFDLHLYCTGSGSPTVVLESGLGDGGFIWSPVQTQVAQTTQVCSYDRPGLGWSDYVRQPFDGAAVAQNLHTLLVNAGLPGPYVLAGHSMGGLYIREFAQQYPQAVAGLVFVDSVHENQSRSQEGGRGGLAGSLDGLLTLCSRAAPTGIFRIFGLPQALVGDIGLPPEVEAAAIATLNRNTYCRTIANELNTSDADTSQPSGPQNLGDIPLIVLVAGRGFADTDSDGPPGMNQAERVQFDQRWLRLQDELAGLSTQGQRIIATQSGHYIHLDQPDLVADAIHELVETARSAKN